MPGTVDQTEPIRSLTLEEAAATRRKVTIHCEIQSSSKIKFIKMGKLRSIVLENRLNTDPEHLHTITCERISGLISVCKIFSVLDKDWL